MTASLRLRPNNKLESEQEWGFQIVTSHSECKVRRGTAEGGGRGRGETWSWKMIDCHRHSRYIGTSTCIAVIVKSVWMRRRWPLSGSTKPEILDVLGAAARNATRRLISAKEKKDRSVTIHFYDIAIRLIGSFDEDDRLLTTYIKIVRLTSSFSFFNHGEIFILFFRKSAARYNFYWLSLLMYSNFANHYIVQNYI